MMLLSSTCSTYAAEVTASVSSAAKVPGPTGHLRYPCALCAPYLTLTGSPITEADTPGETGTARAIPSAKRDRRDETTPGLLLSVRCCVLRGRLSFPIWRAVVQCHDGSDGLTDR